jgi:trigger factor
MDFEVSVTPLGEVYREIAINIPEARFKSQFDREINRAASQAQIKGFRKGKVPRDVVTKMFGEAVKGDVITDLLREALFTTISSNKLNVTGAPKIEKVEGQELSFKAKVAVVPEPIVTNYKNLEVDAVQFELDDAAVENEVAAILDRNAKFEEAKAGKKAAKGDSVELRVERKVIGEPALDGIDESVRFFLEPDNIIEPLFEEIVGKKKGDEFSKTVTYGDDAKIVEQLRGKEVTWNIKVLDIKEKVLPELTDDWVKEQKLGESIAELKENITKSFKEDMERRNEHEKSRAILKKLIDSNTFELPQEMVDEEIRQNLSNLLQGGKKGSRDPNDIPDSYIERFRPTFGPEAEFRVRWSIILSSIANQEKGAVAPEDMQSFLEGRIKDWGFTSVEELRNDPTFRGNEEYYTRFTGIEYWRDKLVKDAKIRVEKKPYSTARTANQGGY